MESTIVRHDDGTFTEYDADGQEIGYGDWRDDAANAYSTDPELVTSVSWSIASESVAITDDNDEYLESPDDDNRMILAINTLSELVAREYPNARHVYIVDGGFENQFCSFSPRCETSDYSIYEPFYDDMTRLEDAAITAAFAQFPN